MQNAAADEASGDRILKEEDTALFDIATALAFDMHQVKEFAAHLLEGSGCKLTGKEFLASLNIYEFTTVPSKTHALLTYW